MLAPGRPSDPIQFIDVRDLGEWTIRMIENGTNGVFNATGPKDRLAMGAFLEACNKTTGSNATFAWVDEEKMKKHGITSDSDFPIWVSPSGPEAGLGDVSIARASRPGSRSGRLERPSRRRSPGGRRSPPTAARRCARASPREGIGGPRRPEGKGAGRTPPRRRRGDGPDLSSRRHRRLHRHEGNGVGGRVDFGAAVALAGRTIPYQPRPWARRRRSAGAPVARPRCGAERPDGRPLLVEPRLPDPALLPRLRLLLGRARRAARRPGVSRGALAADTGAVRRRVRPPPARRLLRLGLGLAPGGTLHGVGDPGAQVRRPGYPGRLSGSGPPLVSGGPLPGAWPTRGSWRSAAGAGAQAGPGSRRSFWRARPSWPSTRPGRWSGSGTASCRRSRGWPTTRRSSPRAPFSGARRPGSRSRPAGAGRDSRSRCRPARPWLSWRAGPRPGLPRPSGPASPWPSRSSPGFRSSGSWGLPSAGRSGSDSAAARSRQLPSTNRGWR